MKNAVFFLLTFVFIATCAVFVYFARDSAPVYVNVIMPDESAGDGITVPQNDRGQSDSGTAEPPSSSEIALVNINTASLNELMSLHGIGTVIGQRIIDYREDNGAFMAIEEIMEVSGIGERVFESIKDRITV
ncbi:MAG: helix-hairpin-helix domain-containing protein [Oscillospiraceae bacterium]|jgi:competence protein ComEA|nr:helix-hairpin-helix domain-containing protein [Oscillospiraceae bacterium]